ncbi:unnamed protein product, partial [Phaeothamnion confervicola]
GAPLCCRTARGARAKVIPSRRNMAGGSPPHPGGKASMPQTRAYQLGCRERLLGAFKSMIGERVSVQLSEGTALDGVLHLLTPFLIDGAEDFQVVLKAVRSTQTRDDASDGGLDENGASYHFSLSRVVHIRAEHFPMVQRKQPAGFATDADISGSVQAGVERELQMADQSWVTPAKPMPTPPSSSSRRGGGRGGGGGGGGGAAGGWDQFEANKRLFNVNSTFDENKYTTQLDTSKLTPQEVRKAEQMAREIEGKASSNPHLREERNQIVGGDLDGDEEDRYSGVLGGSGATFADMPPPQSGSGIGGGGGGNSRSGPRQDRRPAALTGGSGGADLGQRTGSPAGSARASPRGPQTVYKPPALRSREAAEQQLQGVLGLAGGGGGSSGTAVGNGGVTFAAVAAGLASTGGGERQPPQGTPGPAKGAGVPPAGAPERAAA